MLIKNAVVYNMQKYLPFIMYYGSAIGVVYRQTTLFSKHFDRSLQVGLSDPTCMQISDLYIPLTVFEILGFKLKNKTDKKNRRNRLFAISPTLVVQFSPNFR